MMEPRKIWIAVFPDGDEFHVSVPEDNDIMAMQEIEEQFGPFHSEENNYTVTKGTWTTDE